MGYYVTAARTEAVVLEIYSAQLQTEPQKMFEKQSLPKLHLKYFLSITFCSKT